LASIAARLGIGLSNQTQAPAPPSSGLFFGLGANKAAGDMAW